MVGFVGAQYPNSPLPSRNIPRYLRGTEIGWGVPSFRRLVKNNRTGRKSECRRANRTDRTCSRVGKIFLPKPDFRLRHESSILPLVSPAFLPHRLSPPDFRVPILSQERGFHRIWEKENAHTIWKLISRERKKQIFRMGIARPIRRILSIVE